MIHRTDPDAMAMGVALAEAAKAGEAGDIPIGAIVMDPQGVIIAKAGNKREISNNPTTHAEILTLRSAAAALGDWRLEGCTLVVTLEPCPMCAGAVVMSRISRLVFGAWNDKYGAAGSAWDLVRDRRLNHCAEVVGGVLEAECGRLVQEYMSLRRLGGRR